MLLLDDVYLFGCLASQSGAWSGREEVCVLNGWRGKCLKQSNKWRGIINEGYQGNKPQNEVHRPPPCWRYERNAA